FFFSSRRRHTRSTRDWSSDVCSSDLAGTSRTYLAWTGVAVGIATASRFVNGLVGPLCLAIVVLQAPREQRKRALALRAIVMPAEIGRASCREGAERMGGGGGWGRGEA